MEVYNLPQMSSFYSSKRRRSPLFLLQALHSSVPRVSSAVRMTSDFPIVCTARRHTEPKLEAALAILITSERHCIQHSQTDCWILRIFIHEVQQTESLWPGSARTSATILALGIIIPFVEAPTPSLSARIISFGSCTRSPLRLCLTR
jgi:hypothetical protein